MENLHFDYYMRIKYSQTVEKCHYTIKCIPADTDMQKLEHMEITFEPSCNPVQDTDSFGNRLLFGNIDVSHDEFIYNIKGNVKTGLADSEAIGRSQNTGMYKYPHGLAVPGNAIKSYYDKIKLQSASDYGQAVSMMHRLHQDFIYEKNVTDIKTTAEEAFLMGRGVCQDYSHILVALCRLAGIPARYVTGMLIGEGYSHAWVEVLINERWYGLDPTNDIVVTDSHIKIGNGRDAADCMINKGLITGGGNQTQLVRVNVERE